MIEKNALKKLLLLWGMLSFLIANLQARDVYVTSDGGDNSGDGTMEYPVSMTRLTTILTSHNVNNDGTNLNVYFLEGTYKRTSVLTFSATTANVVGLEVTFQPVSETHEVIFDGTNTTSSVRFIATTATNMTLTIKGVEISGFTQTSGENPSGSTSLITVADNSTVILEEVKVNNISSNRNPFVSVNSAGTLQVKKSVISNIQKLSNSVNNYAIYETEHSHATLIFEDCVLDGWKAGTGSTYSHMFWLENPNATLKLTGNTIQNCSTNNRLIYTNQTNANIEIANNTFRNNNVSNYLIYASSNSNFLIYNNTFYSNSSNAIYSSVSNATILNNTIYNSGTFSASGGVIRNNLVFGTSSISGTNASAQRNISQNTYYESGLSNGVANFGNITNFVSTVLSGEEPGKQVLDVLNSTEENHPVLKKGISSGYESYLVFDQKGKKRPENISIGSVDLPDFMIYNGNYSILCNPDGSMPLENSYLIDLSQYITMYPEGADASTISYRLISQPANGVISPLNSRFVSFSPTFDPASGDPVTGIIGSRATFTFEVSYENGALRFSKTVQVKIIIVNISIPMGIIDEDVIRCYTDMGEVVFNAQWKFRTDEMSNNQYYDGFTSPLVGDLNGDGIPEIVVIGTQGAEILNAKATHITILNGQTGEEIVRYPTPFSWTIREQPYHNTPSWVALVDSDRDGWGEIIIATGRDASSGSFDNGYNNRLISYTVGPETFDSSIPKGDSRKLTRKWISERYDGPQYSNGRFIKSVPLPQIVDINEDGIPEILVYNKIYNAETGELMIVMENLEPNDTWLTQNRTVSQSRDYAYVGRDRYSSYSYDRNINFSAIYDLDFDGKMEVIAGGKIYYNLDPTRKTDNWAVKSMDSDAFNLGIGDGYTAVADINGDGKAEVVVVRYVDSNENYITIKVYDPGFVEKDPISGKWVKVGDVLTKEPVLLAETSIRITYYNRQGSHSHVFIGDIDGIVQEVDGKKLKYPEISILGPYFYATGTSASGRTISIPWHPSVKEKYPGLSNTYTYNSSSNGAIMSWTWDETATTKEDRLKVSFVLEHKDRSCNTGFTLFDFDNDGLQDICYRDENTLRIISPTYPYLDINTTAKFSHAIKSWTGYEYPVVADLDGDGSADMLVMGHNRSGTTDDARGNLYAVQANPAITSFAPAPNVWNQYMYSPLRINEDLTTPYINHHPLDLDLAYIREEDMDTGVKTYIYNNTITQVVKSAIFDKINTNGDTIQVIKPFVPTPDAQICNARIVDGKLEFYIKNTGNATVNSLTPYRIFQEDLSTLFYAGEIGVDIFPGDSVFKSHTIPNRLATYIVRVTDESTAGNDLFMKSENWEDCNWADNVLQIGIFVLRDDAATVIQYGEAVIDVLANDELPEGILPVLTESNIPGDLSGSWGRIEIVNNKIKFYAPGNYENGVVELKYKYKATLEGDIIEREANVYIYILQSETGNLVACSGNNINYQPDIKYLPEEIVFHWYSENNVYLGQSPPIIQNLISDRIYYVKPDFSKVQEVDYIKYKLVDFPAGELKINVLPSGNNLYTAKWIGTLDSDWYNPNNWMRVDEKGILYAIDWTPNSCVDVIIPTGALYYPELGRAAECNKITMEDRAMIAGIHHLTYSSAEVELSLKPTERERFVMWSAPMKNIYTGDYHFRSVDSGPVWDGDVYMNFFQAKNPDYPGSNQGRAIENAFTATFGNVGVELSLGQAFNIKVDNRDTNKTFTFPKKNITSYQDELGIHPTARENAHRFIVDKSDLNVNGEMDMPVNGKNTYAMIQVVNPFMAYLDVSAFLEANETVLSNGYKIWDGHIESGFVTVKYDSEGQRYYITNPSAINPETAGYIPPLQSFLVMKKGNASVENLKMSAEWTTTLPGVTSGYSLRSTVNEPEQHILRVNATTTDGQNSTVLYYDEMAVPGYKGDEDFRKLFNPQSNLEVYTFASTNEPLDFNASGDYSRNVRLGIRMNKVQPLTLEFTGMERFRHDVYLIDHDDNEQMYNLSQQNVHTFDIEQYSTGAGIDLPNRFSLLFEYTGMDVGNESVPDNELVVVSRNGHLSISAGGTEIENLQVYNLWGQKIYQGRKSGTQFKIPVEANQFYIVKGQVNYQIKVVKAMAK